MEFENSVEVALVVISLIGNGIFGFFLKSNSDLLAYLKSVVQKIPALSSAPPSDPVCVEGTVQKEASSLTSVSNSDLQLVAKKHILKEHKIIFSHALRLWRDSQSNVSSEFSSLPFRVVSEKSGEVLIDSGDPSCFSDALQFLGSSVQPVESSVSGDILDFLAGEKTKAYEKVEKGVVVGSKITAIGHLTKLTRAWPRSSAWLMTGHGSYKLILSSATYPEIMKSVRSSIWWNKTGLVICTGILAVVVGRRCQYLYREVLARIRYRHFMNIIRAERQSSGEEFEEEDISRICVICVGAPRDCVFVPCGHVCSCSDCANRLPARLCPICRASISQISPLRFA